MKELAIVLAAFDANSDAFENIEGALESRGFEAFRRVPMERAKAAQVTWGLGKSGQILVAFNPLMEGHNRREGAVFPDMELEKAASLLVKCVPGAKENIRVVPNQPQAESLVQQILPADAISELQARIEDRQTALETREPVLKDLSRFKYRAKVELIEWLGRTAIKKTFRPQAMDAKAREKAFFEEIGSVSNVPARILAETENALIYEHIDSVLRERRLFGFRVPLPLRLDLVRAFAEFVHVLSQRGWDPIDLSPANNILVERGSGAVRAIDFEFAHRRAAPVSASQSFFLSGVPDGTDVAQPLNNEMVKNPYPLSWRPYTGLSVGSFLHDPPWMQRLKRVLIHPFWLAGYVVKALARRVKHRSQSDADLRAIALSDIEPRS